MAVVKAIRSIGLAVAMAAGFLWLQPAQAQEQHAVRIAAVKYGGGGDWYQGQTPLPNLIAYVRQTTLIDLAPQADVVELTNDKLFQYPFLFLSGHGNISFSEPEAGRLKRYLEGGGFLYIDDDYGLDAYVRREMKKVLPDAEFVELPSDHPIYHTQTNFAVLPKIHEHDNKPPQGFGIFVNGRLAVYYTYETNISDGWESPEVHHDPPEKRKEALEMGANILSYALMH